MLAYGFPVPNLSVESVSACPKVLNTRIFCAYIQGRFDDVQKPPTLPSRVPREVKEVVNLLLPAIFFIF